MAGNAVVMNFECVASNIPHGETISASAYDAVWITPQHWHMNRGWCALTRSPNTEMAPRIWEPLCIEAAVRTAKVRYYWQEQDHSKGYRVATFEPNINAVKTFHVPLLVCEEAYRSAPHLIDRVLMFKPSSSSAIRISMISSARRRWPRPARSLPKVVT